MSDVAPQPVAQAPQKQYLETMPKLQIDMNSRIHVRVNPTQSNTRSMPGEFLGISHYDFLIIRLPSTPGVRNQLLPRTVVEIRYLLKGAVNTFHTEIITHTVKPALLVFTTYPDRLSILEMRNHRRVSCGLNVLVNTSHGDASGIIADLSMGGCRISLDLTGQSNLRSLAVGDTIVLQVVLSSDGVLVSGTGVVKSVELSGGKLNAGISFVHSIKEFTEALARYLDMIKILV